MYLIPRIHNKDHCILLRTSLFWKQNKLQTREKPVLPCLDPSSSFHCWLWPTSQQPFSDAEDPAQRRCNLLARTPAEPGKQRRSSPWGTCLWPSHREFWGGSLLDGCWLLSWWAPWWYLVEKLKVLINNNLLYNCLIGLMDLNSVRQSHVCPLLSTTGTRRPPNGRAPEAPHWFQIQM